MNTKEQRRQHNQNDFEGMFHNKIMNPTPTSSKTSIEEQNNNLIGATPCDSFELSSSNTIDDNNSNNGKNNNDNNDKACEYENNINVIMFSTRGENNIH